MKPSKLTELARQHNAQNFALLSQKSIAWLQQNVRILRNPVSISAGIVREFHITGEPFKLGQLYFFKYDPKHADTLPYYDIFPLVLVLNSYDDGFLGLNLHYLPVKVRAAFLDQLLPFAKFTPDNDIRRIQITYDILKNATALQAFRPCLKRYLYSHVKSKLMRVEPYQWETALFLPVEQFKKEKQRTVHKESMKMVLKKDK